MLVCGGGCGKDGNFGVTLIHDMTVINLVVFVPTRRLLYQYVRQILFQLDIFCSIQNLQIIYRQNNCFLKKRIFNFLASCQKCFVIFNIAHQLMLVSRFLKDVCFFKDVLQNII
eukprot:TRINITY_DN7130_c0_g1_i2.p13 TRINITY_DN7130_c0_g1~~TRINITY_DN7130_c0_g1_i2.p13  ORF type:complete len:114 (+),score=3.33 TRINITY_DN7130_c0_g1_i2:452-793(+)